MGWFGFDAKQDIGKSGVLMLFLSAWVGSIKATIRGTTKLGDATFGITLAMPTIIDIGKKLFSSEGPFSNTDEDTQEALLLAGGMIIESADPHMLFGMKSRRGTDLDANYIVLDLDNRRVFPTTKYRSAKSVRSAFRKGQQRGFGRAGRTYSRNRQIYSGVK